MLFNEKKRETVVLDDKLNSRVGRVFAATKPGYESSDNKEFETYNCQD
ncbi:hypothetical protein C7447_103466 [Tenacibaculum adriaticum]|uniref:Uncharacterized protein n=1 Tax=Tenacibaculum adriaticum TaxID=413713 RepID=A0A5S5DQQ8_9FLAO|nr:hypothetical protein [Tenacibaculum adriaticum]TYP98293.1 hypothetical protein C7447_103466 [Tenacibaculum adriaticum]